MLSTQNGHGDAQGKSSPQAPIENHNVVPSLSPGLPREAAATLGKDVKVQPQIPKPRDSASQKPAANVPRQKLIPIFRQPTSGYIRLRQPKSANFDPPFFLRGHLRAIWWPHREVLSITNSNLLKPIYANLHFFGPLPPGSILFTTSAFGALGISVSVSICVHPWFKTFEYQGLQTDCRPLQTKKFVPLSFVKTQKFYKFVLTVPGRSS